MGKCAVRLRHFVGVVPLLYCSAGIVVRVEQLSSQCLRHGNAFAALGELNQPAHADCTATITANLDGHLVGCTTNTAGLYFQLRANVLYRGFENFYGVSPNLDSTSPSASYTMRSATERFPCRIICVTKHATTSLLYLRSGVISRFSALRLLAMIYSTRLLIFFRTLGAILRPALLTVIYTQGIE